MMEYRQQKPRLGLTKCPDLVDHYNEKVIGAFIERHHFNCLESLPNNSPFKIPFTRSANAF